MRRRVVLPLQEWSELGSRSRREVRRAVRRGQSHPDVYIAELARAWAVETMRVQSQRSGRRLVDSAVGGTVVAAIWALVPDGIFNGSSLGPNWRDRGLARRLMTIELSR